MKITIIRIIIIVNVIVIVRIFGIDTVIAVDAVTINEALLGGSLCPPSEFQTFPCRNFGRFTCRCRSFVQTH